MSKLKEIWTYVPEQYKLAYWACLITSIILLFLGFFSIPVGQIDPTVLTGTGILFGFATLAVGIKALDKGIDTKITHKDTTLELNNPDPKE